MAIPTPEQLGQLHSTYSRELWESVVPFWLNHSLDREHGGYFNNLGRDGEVMDPSKHVWLQGRQVWMLSKLHNSLPEGDERRAELLDAAKLGADFLRKHAKRAEDHRVYFRLTRDGRPMAMQRKIFSECFYIMGLAEYARAVGDDSPGPEIRQEAREMFARVVEWAKDLTKVGRPSFEGAPPLKPLAIPMILLDLLDVVQDAPDEGLDRLTEAWCVKEVGQHLQPSLKTVLENVSPAGKPDFEYAEGRIMSPGHAIEGGWFLLKYAKSRGKEPLVQPALKMIDWSLEKGWDEEFGGLYYFMDAKGESPSQLEWDMKLWWPHCEALVAALMAWQATGDEKWWDWFQKVHDYSFGHFSDPAHGEWFGYLNRRGEVTHDFKGAAYKGCFHVPRTLLFVEQMLAD